MSRYHAYLNTAKEIILAYTGEPPFSQFIKSYFRQRRKHGGSDRRIISNLCFSYFRLGFAFATLNLEERILAGIFMTSRIPDPVLEAFKPEWNQVIDSEIEKKFSFLMPLGADQVVFPWKDELSEGIDTRAFERSFLIQPDLFIRMRPGFEETVINKLRTAGIEFRLLTKNAVAIPNASNLENLVELDKEVVVQDLNSQRIADLFSLLPADKLSSAWDCCAGSGGKSILLHDHLPTIKLTVSDIRESILANLKKRFDKAGIRHYKIIQTDLSRPKVALNLPPFPFILADVSCSGSGTWSRTPEQLMYFERNRIETFSILQKRILSGVMPYLDKGGYFLYVTCSVFKQENEEAVRFIQDQFGLELIKMEVLKGYDEKADSLFGALLRNT